MDATCATRRWAAGAAEVSPSSGLLPGSSGGANSHRATTTAAVTQSALTEPEVREALRSSLEAGGWADPRVFSAEEVNRLLDELLADIGAITSRFPVGTVVRRHLWRFYAA